MRLKKVARINAVGFFTFWLPVLLAGADKPPPVGFLWIALVVALSAMVGYRRIPTYIEWFRTKKPRCPCYRRRLCRRTGAGYRLADPGDLQQPQGSVLQPSHLLHAGRPAFALCLFGIYRTNVGARCRACLSPSDAPLLRHTTVRRLLCARPAFPSYHISKVHATKVYPTLFGNARS